ncbi:MAG: CCA tRNA nucleotidyltransferase [Pseudomonadota bacterium]
MRLEAEWISSQASQKICRLLTNAGYQAWFVGGCVRNAILGEPVADLDISTDALPDRVMALAKEEGVTAVPTGIDHGTVTVVVDEIPFEITTFRRDIATDGRRATVAFADNMKDDALRRDFTMNALYAGPDGVVVDPLGGLSDLLARQVRFIEDADQRIKEDYLRILRFFRFHAWYGQNGPDPEGLAACAANVDGLDRLSLERITSEMLKLLAAPNPAPAVASMAATGALAQILPGAESGPLAVLVNIEELMALAPDRIRRLALLGGAPDTSLRLSNRQIKQLEQIRSEVSHKEAAYRFGATIGRDRLMIEAASLGQTVSPKALQTIQIASDQVFPISAADLMPDLQGAALGKALKAAEARWIASDFTLTKADLLD